MILTFLVIFLITCGGTALTYVYEKEDSLLARLAAGNVVGSAVFATAGFLLACAFGLSSATVLAALAVALLPVVLFRRKDYRRRFALDRQKARSRTHGVSAKKFLRFAYYVFVFLVLVFFFDRAMITRPDGIFTGGSQNLGDLPFHLGAIFSFTEGNNFPPENPSFAGAKFTYPFLADFVAACFVRLGATVRDAMFVQNVTLGFALVVLLEKFTIRLVGDKLAGKIAPLLLLFSGGLGFIWFFGDYFGGTQSLAEILRKLPGDYTIGEQFRWGNSLVVLFLTQRSLLFGMPLTLIALMKIWEIFSSQKEENNSDKQDKQTTKSLSVFRFPFSVFLVGLLAGTLVLIHVHSLATLFVVCAFLFFFRFDRWRDWLAFAAGVALIAVPELAWSLTGSASNLSKFVEPHFGWDSGKQNFIAFWAKNLGLFVPVLAAGLILLWMRKSNERHDKAGSEEAPIPNRKPKTKSPKPKTQNRPPQAESLLIFYLPFAFLFLVSNTLKLAPWEWDNIKVLVYWFVGSLPFAAFALAWLWEKSAGLKAAAVACFVALTLAGALDVWRTASGQINYKVFDQDAVEIAEYIRIRTAPNALFLNAPTYNSAVVLAGRRSLMRYSGHLSSYGIDYLPRESDVKKIYEGGPLAERLLQKHNIEYVMVSPEETANVAVNEAFFDRYPLVAEIGGYRVYRVK